MWRYDDARLARNMADRLMMNVEKRRTRNAKKTLLLYALNDTFKWTFWTGGIVKVPLVSNTSLKVVTW